MTEILKRLARLPEDRRAQFLAQLRAEVASTSTRGPAPRGSSGPAPLSFNQEPLWTHHRLSPDVTYSMPFSYRLQGALDLAALRSALAGIVARHESLRTSVTETEDSPVQIIADRLPVELPVIDVDGADADARLARALELLRAEARTPFVLEAPPLWRARLYRLAPDDHVLLFNVHHIIFDGWSQGVFAADLAALYRAAKRGETAEVAPLEVQYADFSAWQREWLSGDRLEQLNAWWRDRLTGAPVLEFPTDRPRPTQVSFAGALSEWDLPDDLDPAVNAYARQAGVTAFVVYTAAFLALMARYTGQVDVVIGSPNANRRFSSLEGVTGFFINQLVLRADLSGTPTFRELVGRTRDTVQDTFANGDLPFGKLVDAVRPPRDPSRQPLFQIAFALQDVGSQIEIDGVTVGDLPASTGSSRFDMAWAVTRQGARSRMQVEYSTALFDEETVAGFARHFGEFVRNACAEPDALVSDLELVGDTERDELLRLAVGDQRPVRETTIVAEFEERVAVTPDAVALVVAGAELTYAQLNERANRLAHRLFAAGARPGRLVGLAQPRAADLVASVLAVLKTGAGYLPLDPANPSGRLADILADADAVAVLTHSSLAGRLAASGRPLIVLDLCDDELAAQPSGNPPRAAGPDDVAYVIYTSGSTGKPKGVLIEHRSVVSFIDTTRQLFDLTQSDRVLGFASPNFDVSVFETFAALLTGARLYLATDEERLSVERLQSLMEQADITVIDLPPAVMLLLEPERFDALRIVFVGGEAFSAQLVNRWNPGRRLFNGYGPTECTVTMIVEECPGVWEQTPPIGTPMTNHLAHVLDDKLRPVPYGVPGELVIGGAGLARGYLNRPELTAEKFVKDPFGSAPNGRLYRTGDLVKRLPDGRIAFLGRIDQQIKIRGLRIELGEVEAVAATYPGLGQVAVQPWTDEGGEKHLVAYVTAGDAEPDPARLREHLADKLPSYMIPSFVVTLPELPLTSSGKVNRQALPAPELTVADGPLAEPKTETERVLVKEIFGPLLRSERVAPSDDFFQLGGNSLQAAQLISMINRRFEVEIGLADFFRSPTPAHLGEIVDGQRMAKLDDDQLFSMLESMSEAEVSAQLAGDEVKEGKAR